MKTFNRKDLTGKFKILIVVFLILNTTLFVQAQKIRMVFVGNSITQGVYGYGLSDPDISYATQFGKLMEAAGDTLSIYNAGVSGRVMLKDGPAPIWNESVFPTALKKVPDICLILLGTNDSKPLLWADKGDGFYEDYLSMIDTFRFRNPDTKFIVCDPTPIWEGHPYSTSDPHSDSILVNYTIPLIDSVAKVTGVYLLDLHTPFVDSVKYFDDHLHPNIAGHAKIAQILFDTIQKLDWVNTIEAGKTFIVDFKQVTNPVAEGDSAELSWTTIYADSVFLDGVPVDINGSQKVFVEEGKTYTLTSKNSKNISTFPLKIKTYIPVASNLLLTFPDITFVQGEPFTIYVSYIDQYKHDMEENPSAVVWSLETGTGIFSNQTDTSVVFTPTTTDRIKIVATEGTFSRNKSITPDASSLPSALNSAGFKLFPNPASEKLNIELGIKSTNIPTAKVFNAAGKKLYEKALTSSANSNYELDISSLDNGAYIIGVHSDDRIYYGQFVKK